MTMPQLVRAFPLHRPIEDLQRFAEELRTRRAETDAFYLGFGVRRETWHVQETPFGPWVIGVTEIEDPAASGARYAASSAEFDAWFKGSIMRLSGVDPDNAPLGPPTRQVFEWVANDGEATLELAFAAPAMQSAG
jgi:hypothetical protein